MTRRRRDPERWGARQRVTCSDCGRQLVGTATILQGFYRVRHHHGPDGYPCPGGMAYACRNLHPFACPWPKPEHLALPNFPDPVTR